MFFGEPGLLARTSSPSVSSSGVVLGVVGVVIGVAAESLDPATDLPRHGAAATGGPEGPGVGIVVGLRLPCAQVAWTQWPACAFCPSFLFVPFACGWESVDTCGAEIGDCRRACPRGTLP